jgi:hypothetical protein
MIGSHRASFEFLAEQYRREAQDCIDMAGLVDGTRRYELVRLAEQWIELAQEAEAHRRPN